MVAVNHESLAAFDQALFDACALLRPPEKLSIAEWADKYGYLSSEGSAKPGKFYTSTAEYQREPMEMLSPGSPYETVVQMWSSQTGKTQNALWLTAYHMEHDPAPILFVEPDENLAKTVAKDRIDPMIRDTPVLTPLFGSSKSRGGGNDTLRKQFPGGQLTLVWASSPTQMASRPIRILVTDEEGAYDAAPNKEGNPVTLARARMATFKTNRKHLRVSSPRLRRTCLITKAFEQSDQRHFYVPCPQCGHMQTLEWKQLKWPIVDGRPDTTAAYYVCESSGCEITETDKYTMIRQGEWRAHNPKGGDGRTAGYHLSALYSTIGFTWAELVDEYLACEGLPEKLQAFTNTKLGLPWDEQAEGADLNALQKRAEDYPAQAPRWVVLVTCGADVQKDRIEATKWGYGLEGVMGVIEHRVFYGTTDNAKAGAWLDFDAWRVLRVEHETGLTLPNSCTFVDSSDGNRTAAVYDFCKARQGGKPSVFACKGSSQPGAPLVSDAKRWGRTKTLGVIVGTSTAKDTLFARFQISDNTRPGYVHFPAGVEAGCTAEYFSHLTAEALVTHQTRSGEVARWEKQRARNEALDCAVYAYAAAAFTRAPLKLIAKQIETRAAALKPEEKMAMLAIRLAKAVGAKLPSPSSESVPVSALPKATKPKRRRRIFRRPGLAWIEK